MIIAKDRSNKSKRTSRVTSSTRRSPGSPSGHSSESTPTNLTSRNRSGSRKLSTRRHRTPKGPLLSKSDISRFIDKTPHGQALKICALMLGVYKACMTSWPRCPLGTPDDQLHASGLNLLAAISLLDPDPELLTILKTIEDAVHQGRPGIDAATETATEIINYTFRGEADWERLTGDFEALIEQAGLLELLAALDEVFG